VASFNDTIIIGTNERWSWNVMLTIYVINIDKISMCWHVQWRLFDNKCIEYWIKLTVRFSMELNMLLLVYSVAAFLFYSIQFKALQCTSNTVNKLFRIKHPRDIRTLMNKLISAFWAKRSFLKDLPMLYTCYVEQISRSPNWIEYSACNSNSAVILLNK